MGVTVKLVRTEAYAIAVAESAELFYISGERIHNPRSAHQVRAFAGLCCEEWMVHLHLSATAAVIAAEPLSRVQRVRVDINIGDVLSIDHRDYVVVNRVRKLADPILVPVQVMTRISSLGVSL